jgi:hypothetical protein
VAGSRDSKFSQIEAALAAQGLRASMGVDKIDGENVNEDQARTQRSGFAGRISLSGRHLNCHSFAPAGFPLPETARPWTAHRGEFGVGTSKKPANGGNLPTNSAD